jgi:hypothetical protein
MLPQVPVEPTSPSSRMGVGAIQQIASPQQISRSITSRAASQQDSLDGFSRNMPFPSAFLSTPPATQEIPSTRGKLHYVLIHVTSINCSSPAVSARTQVPLQCVSPFGNDQRSRRLCVPGSPALPFPPVTREASSSESSQSTLSIITISVLLILTPILALSVPIPETAAQTLPVSAVSTETTNKPTQTPSARSLSQRRRREQEREQQQQQTADRRQNEPSQPPNARSLAQRLRRERERQQRHLPNVGRGQNGQGIHKSTSIFLFPTNDLDRTTTKQCSRPQGPSTSSNCPFHSSTPCWATSECIRDFLTKLYLSLEVKCKGS